MLINKRNWKLTMLPNRTELFVIFQSTSWKLFLKTDTENNKYMEIYIPDIGESDEFIVPKVCPGDNMKFCSWWAGTKDGGIVGRGNGELHEGKSKGIFETP